MKVLITGTSGFIGGALLRRCREAGWDVIGLGRRPLLEPGYQVRDLATPLHPVHLDFRPDVVVHAAARSSPWGTRHEYAVQNVKATENVCTFCKAFEDRNT